jgi:glycosyltransferase involved in cell wall biosynthesis
MLTPEKAVIAEDQRDMGMSPMVSVVVPAYNEEAAVAADLREIIRVMDSEPWPYEIVVVDDGSVDDTVGQVQQVEGVHLVRHGRNRGYGAALKTGIKRARGEIIVITDADGTYPAEYIPELLRALEDSDMVVGARVGEGVKIPVLRRPAKWFLNKLASYLAEAQIPDLNSGLRAFRKRDVEPFMGLLPSGFSFTTTITLAMLCNDMLVKYIPINYEHRKGRSKIKPLQDTYNFILLVLRTVCFFNPLKVFMPPALVLLGMGAGVLGYDAVVEKNIHQSELLLILTGLQIGALGLIAEVVSKSRLAIRGTAGEAEPD